MKQLAGVPSEAFIIFTGISLGSWWRPNTEPIQSDTNRTKPMLMLLNTMLDVQLFCLMIWQFSVTAAL